ncbi:transporter substrate-binding domain-containing protein [Nitrospirillum sp. BR 11828]|uniref:transporter substrate-binding domain-containing protein n=1 Tax=Nitrospirillum sp. BR 11828 TaxID=3104325 RepID=UPI002ACAA24B|nr:transporter substrate-binding domain-containing protein [Nitrospirillum sp. BR 11828]MDZ5649138.1 transporter substrate-binding domain-containing protein [Nitrospirillum sp. BR 11828]
MTLDRRALLFALLAVTASTKGRAQAQAPTGPIRLLVPELPVLGAWNAQGMPTGVMVEQAQSILDRAGVRGTIELLPAVRLYTELLRDQGSGGPKTYGMIALPLEARHKAIAPLALTMRANVVAVARRGVPLATPDDLRRLGAVAVSGAGIQVLAPLIQRYGLSVQAVPSMVNGLRMVARGRVDAMLGIASVIDVVAREDGLSDQLGERLEITTMEAWLACAPNTQGAPETAALREAAEALYREGRLDAIARPYFHKADSDS